MAREGLSFVLSLKTATPLLTRSSSLATSHTSRGTFGILLTLIAICEFGLISRLALTLAIRTKTKCKIDIFYPGVQFALTCEIGPSSISGR